jgi:hypothetical protein
MPNLHALRLVQMQLTQRRRREVNLPPACDMD